MLCLEKWDGPAPTAADELNAHLKNHHNESLLALNEQRVRWDDLKNCWLPSKKPSKAALPHCDTPTGVALQRALRSVVTEERSSSVTSTAAFASETGVPSTSPTTATAAACTPSSTAAAVKRHAQAMADRKKKSQKPATADGASPRQSAAQALGMHWSNLQRSLQKGHESPTQT